MKKIITGTLALTILSSMVMAETNNFYVGGGIVYESIDNLDAGQASELHIGKKITNNFGAELRVSKTFNEAKYEGNYDWDKFRYVKGTQKADLTTLGLFGTYTYTPTPNLNIVPKIGLNYLNGTVKFASGTATKEDTITDTALSFGVDLKYEITPDFGTYIGYTRVASDTQHFTVGLERRF